MNFNKNDLIDSVLIRFYDTFRLTLDTADFVPEKYNDKILAYIFKNMKRAFRRIDKEDKQYQRTLRNAPMPVQNSRDENTEDPPRPAPNTERERETDTQRAMGTNTGDCSSDPADG